MLAVGAVTGVGLERLAFKPFRRFRDEASLRSRAMREATLLSSLAVSIVTREVMTHIFGSEMQTIPQAYLLQQPIRFGALSITDGDLIIFAASVVMLGALQYLLFRTRIGLSIRAVANSPLGAQFVGINTDRAIMATFAVGSMLGAVAGILVGLYSGTITPMMGFAPGIKAFVAMVMGGLSSIPGAVICALLLGVSESITTEFLASGWQDLVAYGFLIATLVFFPQGFSVSVASEPEPGARGVDAAGPRQGPGGAVLFVVVPALLSGHRRRLPLQIATTALIFIILAASLNLVTGTAGLLSLGHAGFYGIGAYTAAILSTRMGCSFLVTLPAAGLIAGLIGVLVAIPTMRLVSIYFAVATLGIGEMIYVTLLNWTDFTRGPMGIRSIPSIEILGWQPSTPMAEYMVVAVVAALSLWVLSRLTHSYFGNALRAVREDDQCAAAMGLDVVGLKIAAFGTSCFFAGIAGALLAHTANFISPDQFLFGKSINILAMVVVGGLGSVPGAVIGALVLVILPEALRGVGDFRMVAVGSIMFFSILLLPRGLLGEASALDLFRRQFGEAWSGGSMPVGWR